MIGRVQNNLLQIGPSRPQWWKCVFETPPDNILLGICLCVMLKSGRAIQTQYESGQAIQANFTSLTKKGPLKIPINSTQTS